MEKTTNMDNGEQTIVHNHYRAPSRKRAGSREDYKALLDSTEEARQHDYVKNTPFGEVSCAIYKPYVGRLVFVVRRS